MYVFMHIYIIYLLTYMLIYIARELFGATPAAAEDFEGIRNVYLLILKINKLYTPHINAGYVYIFFKDWVSLGCEYLQNLLQQQDLHETVPVLLYICI